MVVVEAAAEVGKDARDVDDETRQVEALTQQGGGESLRRRVNGEMLDKPSPLITFSSQPPRDPSPSLPRFLFSLSQTCLLRSDPVRSHSLSGSK